MGKRGRLESGALSGGRRKASRSWKQIQASKRNIKKAQKESPSAKARPNVYTNGKNFDIAEESAQRFMDTHSRAQRLYMHAILHSPSSKAVPHDKRKILHDKIVRQDLKGGLEKHKTPL